MAQCHHAGGKKSSRTFHTATEGFRSLDLLHVGAALAFRCGEFQSFDTAARRMAALAGAVSKRVWPL
jgi:hypothetical protein